VTRAATATSPGAATKALVVSFFGSGEGGGEGEASGEGEGGGGGESNGGGGEADGGGEEEGGGDAASGRALLTAPISAVSVHPGTQ